MWAVVNTTRYAAERTWVQDKNANKIWLVAVKITYDIFPDGSVQLAKEQLPVLVQGQHIGEPYQSSLRYESDLYGIKPGTDILLNGSAWQRYGQAAESVDVKMTVGSVAKQLRVFGDRYWEKGLSGISISTPQPFVSMPIIYERAYGGWDKAHEDPREHRVEGRNPIGTGFAIKAEHLVGKALPNIEYPHQLIDSWKDRPAPAGFSAIECHWSPRRELAGTYDEHWQKQRAPLWAEDFNPRYHHAAPIDQQSVHYLHGGETVELFNLTPTGHLTFKLPRVYLTFETKIGKQVIEHRGQLTSVTLEPDASRLIMVWQTALMRNSGIDDLDHTIVSEKTIVGAVA
ncbi:MAG TPA: DUF2169 domain-containing protein [Pseudomonadales bacterium]|nr:DUF2169 domain-containing protein [Pseudomonadales bacterium]